MTLKICVICTNYSVLICGCLFIGIIDLFTDIILFKIKKHLLRGEA